MAQNKTLVIIQDAVKVAMRIRDKETTTTLRMAISEFKKEEIDTKVEINDTSINTILQRMIKQRRDAASQFLEADRSELADKEKREIEILSVFLPKQLSEKELELIVSKEISSTDTSSMQDMGKVMGGLKFTLQGKADMSLVSTIVRNLLSR